MVSVEQDADRGEESTEVELKQRRETCLGRVLSVEVVLGLLCVAALALGSGVTGSLFSALYERAIDDTKANYEDGLRLTQQVGEASLDGTTTFLMRFAVVLVQQPLIHVLEEGVLSGALLRGMLSRRNATITDELAFITDSRPDLWHSLDEVRRSPVESQIYRSIVGLSLFCGSSGIDMTLSPGGGIHATVFNGTSMRKRSGATEGPSGDFAQGVSSDTGDADVAGLPVVDSARSVISPTESVKFLNYGSVGATLGYPVVVRAYTDPVSGKVAEGVAYLSMDMVHAFLSAMAGNALDQELDSHNRVFVTVAGSWLAEWHRARNNPRWVDYDQTGVLVAASVGSTSRTVTHLEGGVMVTKAIPIMAYECDDPATRLIAGELYRNRSLYGEAAKTLTLTVPSTQPGLKGPTEEWYVQATRVKQGYGIDWFMHICIDHHSLYQHIRLTETVLNAKLEDDRVKINSDIREQRAITIGIVVAVSVVSCVGAAVLVHMIFSSMRGVQEAMHCVAQMDLDGLDVTADSNLWETRQMQRDFIQMVDNLLEYRAYVPSSLLTESSREYRPVAEPKGTIAVMFTDIQSSTMLWRTSAEDMNTALENHNTIVRECCRRHNGYEVKTIGDSFMISFSSPVDAALCALRIQKRLKTAKWPAALDLPEGGLVVRIGVNYGPAVTEANPITGRIDYRGSTVNTAARVEGKALGGTICMTSDMFAAIRSQLAAAGSPAVQSIGVHELRGLGGGHELFLMTPKKLHHRFAVSTTDCPQYAVHRLACVETDHHSGSSGSNVERRDRPTRHKTDLQALRSNVTVAVCKLKEGGYSMMNFDVCNLMVRAAYDAVQATDGVINGLAGDMLTALWNASKPCRMHTVAGMSFCAQLERGAEHLVHIGVATGVVLHGNVGTQKARFATLNGPAIVTATALTGHAADLGVFALLGDCGGTGNLHNVEEVVLKGSRLVDAWCLQPEKLVIFIYQVLSAHVRSTLRIWGEDDDVHDSHAAPTEEWTHYVKTFLSEGPQSREGKAAFDALESLGSSSRCETVVKVVLDTLAQCNPVLGCRCEVTYSTRPSNSSWAIKDVAQTASPTWQPQTSQTSVSAASF